MTTETTQPAGTDSAPAALKSLKTARNWPEWLERWQKTEYVEDKLSLLHQAMTFPCIHNENTISGADFQRNLFNVNRALFLLDVADSHVSVYGYQPDEHLCRMNEARLREQVAEKAFKVLCELIFRDRDTGSGFKPYEMYEWSRIGYNQLRTRILDFFQPQSGHSIKNLWWPNQSRQEGIARDFILAYCAWFGKENVHQFICRTVGVKAVRILYALYRTDILLGYREVYDNELLELERLVLAENNRKGLTHDHIPKAFMVAANVEEADFMGSGAATICLVLKSRRLVKKKYERLMAEEYRKRKKPV